jgi:hypothetical protein
MSQHQQTSELGVIKHTVVVKFQMERETKNTEGAEDNG